MNWSRQDESLPGSEKEGGHINCEDSDLEHNDLVKGCNHYTTTCHVMACHVMMWSCDLPGGKQPILHHFVLGMCTVHSSVPRWRWTKYLVRTISKSRSFFKKKNNSLSPLSPPGGTDFNSWCWLTLCLILQYKTGCQVQNRKYRSVLLLWSGLVSFLITECQMTECSHIIPSLG